MSCLQCTPCTAVLWSRDSMHCRWLVACLNEPPSNLKPLNIRVPPHFHRVTKVENYTYFHISSSLVITALCRQKGANCTSINSLVDWSLALQATWYDRKLCCLSYRVSKRFLRFRWTYYHVIWFSVMLWLRFQSNRPRDITVPLHCRSRPVILTYAYFIVERGWSILIVSNWSVKLP